MFILKQEICKPYSFYLLAKACQKDEENIFFMTIIVNLLGKVLQNSNFTNGEFFKSFIALPNLKWSILNFKVENFGKNFFWIMKNIIDRHINLSSSEHLAFFLYFLYRFEFRQRFAGLCVKLQWYVLDVNKDLLNGDIVICAYF